MHKYIKLACLAGLVFTLSGCEDQNNYQYLVTHPAVLKKRMEACTAASKSASNEEKQRCAIVVNASTKFMTVVAEQQIDAEKFGVRILTAESDYAVAKAKVAQLQVDLNTLKSGQGTAAQIHAAEETLAAAKKDANDKRFEVKMLLSVVGVSTPN
jgi:hypothetical protein